VWYLACSNLELGFSLQVFVVIDVTLIYLTHLNAACVSDPDAEGVPGPGLLKGAVSCMHCTWPASCERVSSGMWDMSGCFRACTSCIRGYVWLLLCVVASRAVW
jgi:hypothetical protein